MTNKEKLKEFIMILHFILSFIIAGMTLIYHYIYKIIYIFMGKFNNNILKIILSNYYFNIFSICSFLNLKKNKY